MKEKLFGSLYDKTNGCWYLGGGVNTSCSRNSIISVIPSIGFKSLSVRFNSHKHCPELAKRQMHPLILAASVTVHTAEECIIPHD